MHNTDAIDRVVFEDLLNSTGSDMEFLAELIDDYQLSSRDELDRLRGCYAAGDVTGFRHAAHALKSTSGNLGATRLAGLARELEAMARAGSLEGAAEMLMVLVDQHTRAAAELESLKVAC